MEVAFGASLAGKRSFCGMKHVGLNVAAALRTLGDEVVLASMTGQDFSGSQIRAELQARSISDWATIKSAMKGEMSRYLYKKTKRNPMILPVIMEV